MKITYYVATSSDGFIARENGDVSWLDEMNIDMADTGYDTFFVTIQAHAKNLKIPRPLTAQQGSRFAQAGRSAIHLYAERADRA